MLINMLINPNAQRSLEATQSQTKFGLLTGGSREHIPWEIMECLNKRLLQGLGLFCVILERVVPDCVLSGSRSIFLTGCLNNCYLGGKRN